MFVALRDRVRGVGALNERQVDAFRLEGGQYLVWGVGGGDQVEQCRRRRRTGSSRLAVSLAAGGHQDPFRPAARMLARLSWASLVASGGQAPGGRDRAGADQEDVRTDRTDRVTAWLPYSARVSGRPARPGRLPVPPAPRPAPRRRAGTGTARSPAGPGQFVRDGVAGGPVVDDQPVVVADQCGGDLSQARLRLLSSPARTR